MELMIKTVIAYAFGCVLGVTVATLVALFLAVFEKSPSTQAVLDVGPGSAPRTYYVKSIENPTLDTGDCLSEQTACSTKRALERAAMDRALLRAGTR